MNLRAVGRAPQAPWPGGKAAVSALRNTADLAVEQILQGAARAWTIICAMTRGARSTSLASEIAGQAARQDPGLLWSSVPDPQDRQVRHVRCKFVVAVNAPLHASSGTLVTSTDAPTGTLPAAEHRAIGRLATLVEDVVARLEAPSPHEPLGGLIPACNAALEACLELLREGGDHDDRMRTALDDLRRLGRLLKLVDDADVPFVMRQIRRVLGRFDA